MWYDAPVAREDGDAEPKATSLQARFVRAVLDPLAAFQVAHPWRMLAVAALSVAIALGLASRLSLKTALGELLPENKESVIVADQVNARLPAISTLTLVFEGSDNEGLKGLVDAVAPELRKIDSELVGAVDEGVQQTRKFFEDHRVLYAPLDLVQEVHDEIVERYEYEVSKAAGFLLDDEEDAPPPLTEESIRKRLDDRAKKSGVTKKAEEKFPDGYYLDPKKHVAVILIRTPIGSADVENANRLTSAVRAAVAKVKPDTFDPKVKVGLGGNLLTSAETRSQIEDDLKHVGVWGVSLILGVVFLYYLRLRTLVAMTLTVGIGACWTFGTAYLLVGHLNNSTGFLFSIVVGNGINFGIIYMARYLEARRDHEAADSIRIAQRETWLATLTASAAATAAYGSLAVTDFRGFKHFGLIGGSGMLLCWLATYLFLPAILTLFEKLSPIKPPKGWLARLRGLYGRPFALAASRFPRAIVLGGLAITLVAGVLSYRYVADDPMEYNMRNVGNDSVVSESEAQRLGGVVDPIVGRQGQDGIAVATDRLDQVLPLKKALEQKRDAAAADRKPFKDVVTIYSLLPTEQDKKIELAKDARATLERAHNKKFMSDEEWKKVDDLLPLDDLKTIGVDTLPEQVARHFTEKDGTRGRLLYITPADGRSVWNGTYLVDWAAALRRTELPDGSVVKGSGRSVVFADVILAVGEDAPRAIIVSILATLLIVLLAFRFSAAGIGVMVSVLVGLAWTVAILMLYKSSWPWGEAGKFELQALKLNFLNFVALPITVGVGADYAVNVMQRYRVAGGQMQQVMVETGGAVILCSLTTMLGYSALTLSVNRAVQSFGIAAAAGEICCVLTGVLVLPAVLIWRSKNGSNGPTSKEKTDPVDGSRPAGEAAD
jgi:predicted RND superfamily exporter protein